MAISSVVTEIMVENCIIHTPFYIITPLEKTVTGIFARLTFLQPNQILSRDVGWQLNLLQLLSSLGLTCNAVLAGLPAQSRLAPWQQALNTVHLSPCLAHKTTSLTHRSTCIVSQNKKLSCRRQTAGCFMLSHWRSLKVIRNDTVE